MTEEKSEVESLRAQIDQLRLERSEYDKEKDRLLTEIDDTRKQLDVERKEWDSERREFQKTILELRGTVKNSVSPDAVVKSEYTNEFVPKFVLFILSTFDKKGKLTTLYTKWMSLFNYMFVCGIGVTINMFVLLSFSCIMSLWLANCFAIVVAFLFNWTFSVGPLGFLFGLSPRVRVEKE